ncbi:hypothetical protein EVG20_g9898 [Dentipellis fragilis]|uniref:Uncharacterized protein n=1 Tax=Dentipellis fragilis TaxID=205917 RepID=A0A4Y9XXU3_9AGAM|nr:hypothetical protein EVG20_g9898 [Dentipellis fragilis]
MSKLVGRNFEDLLQASTCAIPVFEELLPPPHNKVILDFLFTINEFLAYAKLRLHTDTSLGFFETNVTRLGDLFRKFVDVSTCSEFRTVDLPQEEAARGRRKAALMKKAAEASSAAGTAAATQRQPAKASSGPKIRAFTMSTYKMHSLADYPGAIRRLGTLDNYNTQTGELEHRRVKRFYSRTNKIKFTLGITKQQQRERILHRMREQDPHIQQLKNQKGNRKTTQPENQDSLPSVGFEAEDPLAYTSPKDHYHMSTTTRHQLSLTRWLRLHAADPAFKHFLPRLKNHILARLEGRTLDGDNDSFTPEQQNSLVFLNNCIYRHKVLRVNYTTYDLRRDQDSLNPRTQADIMVLSHDDGGEGPKHAYWYARIIGVFHTYVARVDTAGEPLHVDFLWVRWFGRDLTHKSGWKAKGLPQIGFVPDDGTGDAFGFVDPNDVIRAVHLIPAFAYPCTETLLGHSVARLEKEYDTDWTYFYVNIFVDRDMFMRFRGGGVGHKSTRDATRCFYDDHDPMDVPKDDNHDESAAETDTEVIADRALPLADKDPPELQEGGEDIEEEEEDTPESEEEDYGYDGLGSGQSDEDGEVLPDKDGGSSEDGGSEGEVDPEDGEGPDFDDVEDREGFAAL